MYRERIRWTLGLLALMSNLTGCKRQVDIRIEDQLPEQVITVAPKPARDSLAKYGLPTNLGKTPPLMEGIYFSQPNLLIGSNLPADQDSVNIKVFLPRKYRFQGQSQDRISIKVDYKGFDDEAAARPNTDIGTSQSGFVSGNGTNFTVFAELNSSLTQTKNGKTFTATIKELEAYAGEITPTGVRNFVWGFYIKEKTDPGNLIVPVGTTRVFKDGTGFADKFSTFRVGAQQAESQSRLLSSPVAK